VSQSTNLLANRKDSNIIERNFTNTSKIFKFFSAFSIACMRRDLSFQYPGAFLFLVCSFASPCEDRRLRVVVLKEIERMKLNICKISFGNAYDDMPRASQNHPSLTHEHTTTLEQGILLRILSQCTSSFLEKAAKARRMAQQCKCTPLVRRHSNTSFPQAGTARRAVGYWKDVNNQRKFLDSLRAELGLTQVRMWERRLVSG